MGTTARQKRTAQVAAAMQLLVKRKPYPATDGCADNAVIQAPKPAAPRLPLPPASPAAHSAGQKASKFKYSHASMFGVLNPRATSPRGASVTKSTVLGQVWSRRNTIASISGGQSTAPLLAHARAPSGRAGCPQHDALGCHA